jgi:prevent-host-death family protein
MKTISFTDFRKKASDVIDEVEQGEAFILMRRGKPVAEVVPYSDETLQTPSWKQSLTRLRMKGSDLSSAILDEREAS